MDKLEEMVYYQTIIYAIEKPEFLESVRSISDKYLEISKSQDPDHDKRLTLMTGTYAHEPEVAYFSQYVAQSAWNILSTQGFAMEFLATHFNEMWTQEHRFGSSMDTHVHPYGAQITAFYFLDVPENSNKLITHDPRPAKVISSLYSENVNNINMATDPITFTPKEGLLIFTNAWLPHSFSRNESQNPFRFVHMCLGVIQAPERLPDPNVEII